MKNYFLAIVLFLGVFLISGCDPLATSSGSKTGGVFLSRDSGTSWELKNKVDDTQNISKVDVLSMTIDPIDTERIYLGTKDRGVVMSKNGSENWEKLKFPGNKVYGIAINYFKPANIYVLCTVGERGKIYKTDDYGENWKEIYTEPADGAVIISLAMDKNNPEVLYVGTSKGIVIKTVDGGETWRNLYSANGPVSQILFGGGSDSRIYYLVHKKEIVTSDNNGNNFKVITAENEDIKKKGLGEIYSIAVDNSGELYIGTKGGMFRSLNGGETVQEVDVIASSKEFPIRSLSINPINSQELIYSAAQAIYKSTDGGKNWSTYQLNTGKLISSILFNPSDVNTVYAGLRDFSQ
jgi:photosystem II stability/assembly factor-like uncharacterized protein